MNKDAELLAEAYQKVLEGDKHCSYAKEGCDCDKCNECKHNQKIEEAAKKPDKDGDGVPDWADKKDGEDDNAPKNKKGKLTQAENRERFKKMVAGKKKSMHKENAEMAQAYETILEYKLINKKFARRYNKLTSAMLKAEPGSEEYGKIKSEREDLVSILKDHGMSPKDLEEYLIKKERELPLPEVPEQNNPKNQYNDNSYSDTADIPAEELPDNTIEVNFQKDMASPQSEVATMPPDQPAQVAVNQ